MSIAFYDENAEAFFRSSVDADMSTAHQRFAALLPAGGRVLDAGCGAGRDALALHRLGFQVTATEAAPKLAEMAAAHTGLPVQILTFEQMDWREAFDGIWACASLLHVPREDLPRILRKLRDALAPGGAWFMSFKYGQGDRQIAGRHFTDLDEGAALALLAEVGGLELVSMEVIEDGRPEHRGEWWLSLFCRRS